MITRHEMLAALHELIKPRRYLEVGVQAGHSLALAAPDCMAIGVDAVGARELDRPLRMNEAVHTATSGLFFTRYPTPQMLMGGSVDLAFIDGSHLAEDALADFINIERWGHPGTVVVFDDVLPRNQFEASRIQCPGDWAGDVWRVYPLLVNRNGLTCHLVNTAPTGTLVVWGLDPRRTALAWSLPDYLAQPAPMAIPESLVPRRQTEVPPWVLHRSEAKQPDWVLSELQQWLAAQKLREAL